jgi:hypothetical protein
VAKHLKLGGEPGSQTWTLADDVDLGEVRERLARAMNEGTSVTVAVKLESKETAELLVNGRVVPVALVWEEPDARQGPGFTMID